MIGTRRLVRLHLMMLLVILLPFTGYLWSVINHHAFVYLLIFVSAILLICIESINQLTEREAKSMQLKLQADRGDLDVWKEKVRELDRIVAKITDENENFRHQALERAAHADDGKAGEAQ